MDRETRHEATEALEGQGFAVRCVSSAERAYSALLGSRADALLLSTELPESEGLRLCKRATTEELRGNRRQQERRRAERGKNQNR